MGRKFDVEYDEFSGGHFVGAMDVRQPSNSWTGINVVVTPDQGFLMPSNGFGRLMVRSGTLPVTTDPFIATTTRTIMFATTESSVGRLHSVFPSAFPSDAFVALSAGGVGGPRTVEVFDVTGNQRFASMNAGQLTLVSPTGGLASTVTTPFPFATGLWQWNLYTISAHNERNFVYFSNPGDPASWAATNFIRLGASSSTIIAIVPTVDVLYVAATDGWYAITGVLGQTTNVRKIGTFGMSTSDRTIGPFVASNRSWAAAAQRGIVFVATNRGLRALQGTTVNEIARPHNGLGGSYTMRNAVSCGDTLVALSDGVGPETLVWIWSETQQNWRVCAIPSPSLYGYSQWNRHALVRDDTNASDKISVVLSGVNGGITEVNALWVDKEEVTPTGTTATVDLAHYESRQPFRVHELMVEVDFGFTPMNDIRQLTAQIVTGTPADVEVTLLREPDGTATPYTSTALTKRWTHLSSTIAGDREMVRFRPSDATAAFTAQPRLTMKGVKIRRVVMRCEEL